jgi:hypothetical protein
MFGYTQSNLGSSGIIANIGTASHFVRINLFVRVCVYVYIVLHSGDET